MASGARPVLPILPVEVVSPETPPPAPAPPAAPVARPPAPRPPAPAPPAEVRRPAPVLLDAPAQTRIDPSPAPVIEPATRARAATPTPQVLEAPAAAPVTDLLAPPRSSGPALVTDAAPPDRLVAGSAAQGGSRPPRAEAPGSGRAGLSLPAAAPGAVELLASPLSGGAGAPGLVGEPDPASRLVTGHGPRQAGRGPAAGAWTGSGPARVVVGAPAPTAGGATGELLGSPRHDGRGEPGLATDHGRVDQIVAGGVGGATGRAAGTPRVTAAAPVPAPASGGGELLGSPAHGRSAPGLAADQGRLDQMVAGGVGGAAGRVSGPGRGAVGAPVPGPGTIAGGLLGSPGQDGGAPGLVGDAGRADRLVAGGVGGATDRGPGTSRGPGTLVPGAPALTGAAGSGDLLALPRTAARLGDDGAPLTAFARPMGGYQARPAYPESARKRGVQGTTVLRFEVLRTGRVGEIVVDRTAGDGDLDRAAMEAVKHWRFEPARRGDTPVAVWVTLPVQFELR
jgi:TonB family protein